jgi:DNA-binding NtrC family response regulator
VQEAERIRRPRVPLDATTGRPTRRAVLLVHMEAGVRRALARALRSAGLGVIEADDGRAALRRLDQPTPVELVLAGAGADGMGGRSLEFALAHLRPGLPVIVLGAELRASEAEATPAASPLDTDSPGVSRVVATALAELARAAPRASRR